jgi:hypothetical protein
MQIEQISGRAAIQSATSSCARAATAQNLRKLAKLIPMPQLKPA